jgi:hypothetical protein
MRLIICPINPKLAAALKKGPHLIVRGDDGKKKHLRVAAHLYAGRMKGEEPDWLTAHLIEPRTFEAETLAKLTERAQKKADAWERTHGPTDEVALLQVLPAYGLSPERERER